jgi:hypothetical protein
MIQKKPVRGLDPGMDAGFRLRKAALAAYRVVSEAKSAKIMRRSMAS